MEESNRESKWYSRAALLGLDMRRCRSWETACFAHMSCQRTHQHPRKGVQGKRGRSGHKASFRQWQTMHTPLPATMGPACSHSDDKVKQQQLLLQQ